MEILTNEYRSISLPEGYSAVELDMGCGRGGFTRDLAQRFPDRLILASDVMLGRLRQVEAKLRRAKISNVLLLRSESGMMVEYQLPWQSVDRIHLLCPDPWPKDLPKKGRRLASTAFFGMLAHVLKPGGVFHFSSDDVPYFQSVRTILEALPIYEIAPEALEDIADLKTDFERQWQSEGKEVYHVACRLKNFPITNK